MKSKKSKSSKEEIKKEISDLKDKAKKIKEKGRDLTEHGQSLDDLADATDEYIDIVENIPPIDSVVADFRLLNQQFGRILAQADQIDFNLVNSTYGTASISVIDSLHPNYVLPLNNPAQHEVIVSKYNEIEKVTQKNATEAEVIELLKEFGFDKSVISRKSALEQFNIALSAFKKPVTDDNPISTSLIPMRECIRTMIDSLLKCRPEQVKTKKEGEKIISIGQQLKRDTIPEGTIFSLSNKWKNILGKELSSAKEVNISRDEWRFRITQSMLFIKSLLTALDPQKFK